MADETLTRLTDIQLAKLFAATSNIALSARERQIVAEMERRGFIYDVRGRDFIPCEEWNKRYGDYAPMDCDKQARRLDRR